MYLSPFLVHLFGSIILVFGSKILAFSLLVSICLSHSQLSRGEDGLKPLPDSMTRFEAPRVGSVKYCGHRAHPFRVQYMWLWLKQMYPKWL